MKSAGFLEIILIGSSVAILALSGCMSSDNKNATPRAIVGGDGSSSDSSQKVSNKVPPLYDSQQWSVGLYWIWKSPKNICLRWQIKENSENGGVVIEESKSQNCDNFKGVPVTRFHFFPMTGEIDWIAVPGGDPTPVTTTKTVFALLYGDPAAKNYQRQRAYSSKQKAEFEWVYALENTKSWYIDVAEHPLRGVLFKSADYVLYKYGGIPSQTK